jgi:hypothetical protein
MSQTSHLKSTQITNLDATPMVPNTTGEGAPGYLRSVNASISSVSLDLTGSTYQLVRVISNAKIKAVYFEAAAMSQGDMDLSVYYSDSTIDGTSAANQGLVVPSTGAEFFASDIDCSSAVAITDKTNESGNYPANLRNQPLWQALGLTADPGGFFDIVAVCHTATVTTGALMGLRVDYVD